MRIEHLRISVEEQAAMEYANAQAAQNRADTDFIAMMSDIDLDIGEEEPYEQQV